MDIKIQNPHLFALRLLLKREISKPFHIKNISERVCLSELLSITDGKKQLSDVTSRKLV